ncbi:MAG: GtrA family protein [Lentisphaerae bacterium]|nr:GtrA family protein [Lentisphaerota bacterium]
MPNALKYAFVRFSLSSLLATAVDYGIFAAALAISDHLLLGFVAGRTAALSVNFTVNRGAVFHSRGHTALKLAKYLGIALMVFGLHYGSARTLLTHTSLPPLAARMLGESVIFLFSYGAQKTFVFRRRPPDEASAHVQKP